jgi:hypothetical protein
MRLGRILLRVCRVEWRLEESDGDGGVGTWAKPKGRIESVDLGSETCSTQSFDVCMVRTTVPPFQQSQLDFDGYLLHRDFLETAPRFP